MPQIEEKFDQKKIDSLKRYLVRESAKSRAKDYEIIVDDFKVVSRTNDIDEFEDYEQEINGSTRSLCILIYDGPGTNRNTRYSFSLKEDSKSLNGLGEVDHLIAQRLQEKDKEFELVSLREKLQASESQLQESEEYAEQLEQKLKDMESGQLKRHVSIAEFTGLVLSGLLKQNPHILNKLPGGEALAGIIGMPAPNAGYSPEESVNASFEKAPSVPMLSPEILNRLSLIEQMQERFDEQQMIAIFSLIDHLSANPDKISSTLNFLKL